MHDIKSDLNFFYILYNTFHILQFLKMSLLTGVYGHVGHHILHEEEKIGGEILLWDIIPRKTNYLYIFHCT